MAKCPKCGVKLHIYNVSQFCPKCGVNMRYVNFEENFIREAKIAELTQAVVSMKVRRLKAALIGGKIQIVRLVVMLLPLISLLIPSGSFSLNLPYYSHTVQFSALGLYGTFTNGDLDYIGAMVGSDVFGASFTALRTALFAYIAPAAFAVIVLLASILCFVSIKNMQKIISALSAVGIAATVASVFFFGAFVSKAKDGVILTGKMGFGWLVTVLAFAAVIAINLIIDKKGIKVVYDEGIEERVAVYHEYKAGKVTIDELPQPVVETEATRKIDEEIAKEEAALQDKAQEEAKQ